MMLRPCLDIILFRNYEPEYTVSPLKVLTKSVAVLLKSEISILSTVLANSNRVTLTEQNLHKNHTSPLN